MDRNKLQEFIAHADQTRTECPPEHMEYWRGCRDAFRQVLTARDDSSAAGDSPWRSVESAPKDGSEFIACFPLQGNVMVIASWNRLYSRFESKGDTFSVTGAIWHPLPAAPQPTAKTGSNMNARAIGDES